MPIFVKHNGKCYKVPDEILAKSAVPKSLFESRLQELENKEKAKAPNQPKLIEFAEDEFDGIGG
jgi:hypothetical protein